MDNENRLIMDRLQRSFPIDPEPFRCLGERLGLEEGEVIGRIGELKRQHRVRQISAIFNTGALGYQSSLVAMAVPEDCLDPAVRAVNAYPGVSHNYLRPASYNLWFTVAVPPGRSLESVVETLSIRAGGWPTLILPALRKYKLAVVLDLLDEDAVDGAPGDFTLPRLETSAPFQPSSTNIRVARCLQEDLPLVSRPFKVWAEELGMPETELLKLIVHWTNAGWIRRFAAVLNHREVGFAANGMVVWRCPEERIDGLGNILAAHSEVSHCYHRPAGPEWPYNLYAMIHGRTEDECRAAAERLSEAIGMRDHRILFSTREFKKIRLKLFWEDPADEEGSRD
ncbi:MAG: Lrp/AsnC family transcriptional regulator [Thermodesulfobacteriota bacterium]|nr:Lrp/AsnC family transcriptional regulator [Thermodesulfobacteriota bacterium]